MNKRKAIVVEVICFLFILLFTYAALSKLMQYQQFVFQIRQSPLLNGFENTVAWLVPSGELVIALMLVISRFRQAGLFASFSLMFMFTIYIAAVLQLDENIPCSCGGILSDMGWTEHLIFNIGFVILGLIGIVLNAQLASKVSSPDKVNKDKKEPAMAHLR